MQEPKSEIIARLLWLHKEQRRVRDLDLGGADFSGANLDRLNADGVRLVGARLTKTQLNLAHLVGCDFARADLAGADLTGSTVRLCNFDGARAAGSRWRDATLEDSSLQGADFSGADLTGAHLTESDWTRANLRGAILHAAEGEGVGLRGADLRSADLSRARLPGADLRGADLSQANLAGADLADADLRGAILTGASLDGAITRGMLLDIPEDEPGWLPQAPIFTPPPSIKGEDDDSSQPDQNTGEMAQAVALLIERAVGSAARGKLTLDPELEQAVAAWRSWRAQTEGDSETGGASLHDMAGLVERIAGQTGLPNTGAPQEALSAYAALLRSLDAPDSEEPPPAVKEILAQLFPETFSGKGGNIEDLAQRLEAFARGSGYAPTPPRPHHPAPRQPGKKKHRSRPGGRR